MSRRGLDVLLVGFEAQENLGLRSIAAFLARAGVRVGIQPLQETKRDRILEGIRRDAPRIVGFSLIFQRMLPEFAGLIGYLRERGVTAHFTMGGHFPTFAYAHVLRRIAGLDTVVRHEGEETLLALLRTLDDPASWARVPGLAFRRNGRIHASAPRPLLPDLDVLPFPLRDRAGPTHRGIGIRSIAASRGCYYDCSFCSIHEFYAGSPGRKRRCRSPDNVLAEMRRLHDALGVRIFIFQDDDVFMRAPHHRRWMMDFLAGLERTGLARRILWRISCRVDDVDRDLLARMRVAGLVSVYLGIEAGNDRSLRTFNKRYRVSDVHRALKVLRSLDLPYEFGFMLLEPNSTLETVRENIEFLRTVGAEGRALVHFCKMAPYAGTPIARRLETEGRLEGTLDAPDYRFRDPRLDFLQLFYSRTFNFRNFDDAGLVERLRFAKFDACVVERWFSDRYDAAAYSEDVRELIRRANASAVETMSLAAHFVEERDPERILAAFGLLDELGAAEAQTEAEITRALDEVMARYGFRASPAPADDRVRADLRA